MVETPSATEISRPHSLIRDILLSPVTAAIGTAAVMAFLYLVIPH